MRSVLRRNATLRRTVMSESESASRRTSQPFASDSCSTALALCLSRPERAYTAFERVLPERTVGERKERRAFRGESARYYARMSSDQYSGSGRGR